MSKFGRASRDAEYYTRVAQIPNRKIWFVNGDLVHVEHIMLSEGIVTLWNFNKDKRMTMTLTEFKRKRVRAFSVLETSKLLNYNRKSVPRLVVQGILPKPTGSSPGGATAFHIRAYYSQDQILTARKLLAQTHQGRPRKDGHISNSKVPTEQELRVALGDAMLVYVMDRQGNYVPIFSETI